MLDGAFIKGKLSASGEL